MKIIKHQPTLKIVKKFDGLITCEFEHVVQSTKASVNYTGPTISKEEWRKMLSFFKWTYDTTHSEAQVRLFVNLKERAWRAWAFPQEARTGMSAHELDNPEAQTQRASFNGDWIYFGTVHHHCACGAFQSSVDESNERNQDGLHITIGKMDEKHYDLHARFYLNGACFEPDMSLFWDIGKVSEMLPRDLWDRVARHQMTEPSSLAFPQQWRTNLVEIKAVVPFYRGAPGNASVGPTGWAGNGGATPWADRVRAALDGTLEDAIRFGLDYEELAEALEFCGSDGLAMAIYRNCRANGVDPDDIWRMWQREDTLQDKVEQMSNELADNPKDTPQLGLPNHVPGIENGYSDY